MLIAKMFRMGRLREELNGLLAVAKKGLIDRSSREVELRAD